jgi:hypothetical protein
MNWDYPTGIIVARFQIDLNPRYVTSYYDGKHVLIICITRMEVETHSLLEEGSREPGTTEIEWDTSAFGL